MHNPLDASTIIFALLAIFVLWKLRSVLGSRTGSEKEPPQNSFFHRPGNTNDNNDRKVIPLPGAAHPGPAAASAAPQQGFAQAASPADPWKGYAAPGSRNAAVLDEIAAMDRGFDLEGFIGGAKTAYEMIVTAFAAGDRQALRNLLDQDVYESFVTAIAGRESRNEKMKTTLVSIDKVDLEDASLRDRTVQLTLRFASKLISATESNAGTIIDGSPDKVVDMIDIWTFARDSRSPDPNWKLVATQTGH